jgi:hypothetical protein
MFTELGDVEEEHNGNLKITMDGHAFVFQPASESDAVTPEEIRRIRNLLRSSPALEASDPGAHLLLVMDHSEARIYRTEMRGSVPELVTPYNPEGRLILVHNSSAASGSELANTDAYFRDIARSIRRAERILIFGSGTGSSAAMSNFAAWLGKHHVKIFDRIIATVTIDLAHMTEPQLLAKAREIYARK